MSKTFYERLRGYYLEVGKVLRGESSSASIFPNSTDIGMSREKIYAEVLRLHLPSSCNVLYGGFLFGIDGNESKQIDIIITNDLNLQFNFHNKDGGGKSFACVDGTIAVVSVKSHLTSKELIDSLENLSSIPEKTPLEQARPSSIHFFTGYENWPYKIVYASNGIGLETLLNTLNDFYSQNPGIPLSRRPELIHVPGKYVISLTGPLGGRLGNGVLVPPNTFYPLEGEFTDVYALSWAIANIQEILIASKLVGYKYGYMVNRLAP